ncbi:hypothetical protein PoB_001539300 [Plakobranchus ocellatus]|uniref:Uncharacterized protein n=1 Tax=Plakobranchus ocellatus TaxID=259542 RepID=A0AAV3Z2R7_9GAST|nr:hypothetical protein PoB_001539300 [Plakobranchus ocellatus]
MYRYRTVTKQWFHSSITMTPGLLFDWLQYSVLSDRKLVDFEEEQGRISLTKSHSSVICIPRAGHFLQKAPAPLLTGTMAVLRNWTAQIL